MICVGDITWLASDSAETSLIAKTITVFDAAGLDKLISPGDVVAIKVHCGEWNPSRSS